jgi:hypothetical protein
LPVRVSAYSIVDAGLTPRTDHNSRGRYLISLLECQHQEKVCIAALSSGACADDRPPQPSIQKIVLALATDCLGHLSEESVSTDAYRCDVSAVSRAVRALVDELGPGVHDRELLAEAMGKTEVRIAKRQRQYDETVRRLELQVGNKRAEEGVSQVEEIIKIATASSTHVRRLGCWRSMQANDGDVVALRPAGYSLPVEHAPPGRVHEPGARPVLRTERSEPAPDD